MPLLLPPILYEDNHCLALDKPAGSLSTHFQGGEETLDRSVKKYLKEKYQKPGNVFLGVVHRLDRAVSGVLLFARTSKGAARLAEQFRDGTVEKTYWAIVEGRLQQTAAHLEDWLRKDEADRRVHVTAPHAEGAKQASLDYTVLACFGDLTLLELRPQTGRKHQLRVQLAHRGHPIFGDARYGAVQTFGDAIALHARTLTFLHPIRHEPITLSAELPRAWRGRFDRLLQDAKQ